MLIGSHNSASYSINWNVGFWHWSSKWEWLRIAAKWIPPIRRLVEKYAKTQSVNIYDQLAYGVDILDIRVSCAQDIFYTSHTFCGIPYTDVLTQLSAFMYIYKPAYTITIMLTPDRNNTTIEGHEFDLLNMTINWFGEHISQKKIKIYYQPSKIELNRTGSILDYSQLNKYWFNVNSVPDFINRYKNIDFSSCAGIDCILTPQPPHSLLELFEFIWVGSIERYAKSINNAIMIVLRVAAEKNIARPYYCMFDYVTKELVIDYLRISE